MKDFSGISEPSLVEKGLDAEWIELLKAARNLGITIEEIRNFINVHDKEEKIV